ncbi:MAG: hypothetical protein HY909_09405 [Deltaproteobacteria bacterium]|nr:hypothetical protein [Deltaproteobacteria bacterium]
MARTPLKPAPVPAAPPEPTTPSPTDSLALDPANASQDFDALRPALDALDSQRLRAPTFALRDGAVAGLSVAAFALGPVVWPGFEALARAGLFRLELLKDLPRRARALWYARHKVETLLGTRSEVRVPTGIVAEAQRVRERMLKVLGFFFDEGSTVGTLLAHIRRGTGYHDLADDLTALAQLYETHKTRIARLPEQFLPADRDDAQRLATAILSVLADDQGAELRRWTDLQARTVTHFLEAYEEVLDAGRYLLRHDPAAETRFPSVYSLGRGAPAKVSPPAAPAPAPTPDPAG